MCEPVTLTSGLAIAGVVAAGVGTAATVYSAYEQQKSQNAANNYNAAMLQRSAQIKDMQAATALEQGQVAEDAQRKKVQSVIGSQRAAASAQGLLVDSGTAQQVTEDTAGFGELDALTIRNNAQREAWGIKNESQDLSSQSAMTASQNVSPISAAVPSLLNGASNLSKSIYGYQQQFGRPASVKAYAA